MQGYIENMFFASEPCRQPAKLDMMLQQNNRPTGSRQPVGACKTTQPGAYDNAVIFTLETGKTTYSHINLSILFS